MSKLKQRIVKRESVSLEYLLEGLRDSGAVVTIKVSCTCSSRDEEHLISDKLRTRIIRVVADELDI